MMRWNHPEPAPPLPTLPSVENCLPQNSVPRGPKDWRLEYSIYQEKLLQETDRTYRPEILAAVKKCVT